MPQRDSQRFANANSAAFAAGPSFLLTLESEQVPIRIHVCVERRGYVFGLGGEFVSLHAGFERVAFEGVNGKDRVFDKDALWLLGHIELDGCGLARAWLFAFFADPDLNRVILDDDLGEEELRQFLALLLRELFALLFGIIHDPFALQLFQLLLDRLVLARFLGE